MASASNPQPELQQRGSKLGGLLAKVQGLEQKAAAMPRLAAQKGGANPSADGQKGNPKPSKKEKGKAEERAGAESARPIATVPSADVTSAETVPSAAATAKQLGQSNPPPTAAEMLQRWGVEHDRATAKAEELRAQTHFRRIGESPSLSAKSTDEEVTAQKIDKHYAEAEKAWAKYVYDNWMERAYFLLHDYACPDKLFKNRHYTEEVLLLMDEIEHKKINNLAELCEKISWIFTGVDRDKIQSLIGYGDPDPLQSPLRPRSNTLESAASDDIEEDGYLASILKLLRVKASAPSANPPQTANPMQGQSVASPSEPIETHFHDKDAQAKIAEEEAKAKVIWDAAEKAHNNLERAMLLLYDYCKPKHLHHHHFKKAIGFIITEIQHGDCKDISDVVERLRWLLTVKHSKESKSNLSRFFSAGQHRRSNSWGGAEPIREHVGTLVGIVKHLEAVVRTEEQHTATSEAGPAGAAATVVTAAIGRP